jgi:hypothetical protein
MIIANFKLPIVNWKYIFFLKRLEEFTGHESRLPVVGRDTDHE